MRISQAVSIVKSPLTRFKMKNCFTMMFSGLGFAATSNLVRVNGACLSFVARSVWLSSIVTGLVFIALLSFNPLIELRIANEFMIWGINAITIKSSTLPSTAMSPNIAPTLRLPVSPEKTFAGYLL